MHNGGPLLSRANNVVLSSLSSHGPEARCALVPIKALANAKQRLKSVLNEQQRRQLSLAMAHDVLTTLTSIPNLALTVCAGDEYGVQLARKFNAAVLYDTELPQPGLDAIAGAFAQRIANQGYRHAMVVHADIPLLNARTVEALFEQPDCDVALVADRHHQGTNVLRWRIESGFVTHFGVHSRAQHLTQCAALNLRVKEITCEETALDIDSFEDLQTLYQSHKLMADTHTYRLLSQASDIKNMLAGAGGASIPVAKHA